MKKFEELFLLQIYVCVYVGWVDKNTKKYILPDNLDRIFVKIVKKDLSRIYGIGRSGVFILLFIFIEHKLL